jgi:hypothetical protein
MDLGKLAQPVIRPAAELIGLEWYGRSARPAARSNFYRVVSTAPMHSWYWFRHRAEWTQSAILSRPGAADGLHGRPVRG